MNGLASAVGRVLPWRLRRALAATHREIVFRRGMRRFQRDPAACVDAAHPTLSALIYGWGNSHWSAHEEFLAACVEQAMASRGPILECGSGLSTILLGAIAEYQSRRLWTLEHDPQWAAKAREVLRRYRLDSVDLCTAPLRSYGSFHWYDAPLREMPESFSLVVCDGPPGRATGGRYGLVPVMKGHFADGCVLLLDDAERDADLLVARRWAAELDSHFVVAGRDKPFVVMRVQR